MDEKETDVQVNKRAIERHRLEIRAIIKWASRYLCGSGASVIVYCYKASTWITIMTALQQNHMDATLLEPYLSAETLLQPNALFSWYRWSLAMRLSWDNVLFNPNLRPRTSCLLCQCQHSFVATRRGYGPAALVSGQPWLVYHLWS